MVWNDRLGLNHHDKGIVPVYSENPKYYGLNIVIHGEFIRMRALAKGGDFMIGFVPDPGIDHVFSKNIFSKQSFVNSRADWFRKECAV